MISILFAESEHMVEWHDFVQAVEKGAAPIGVQTVSSIPRASESWETEYEIYFY